MNHLLWTIAGVALVPALVSAALTWLILRFVPEDAAGRYASAVGCGVGFFCGFAILETTALKPTSAWHWIAWCSAAAMVAGPVCLAQGIRRSERWLVHAIVALVAALLLVPARILPVSGWHVVSFTVGAAGLSVFVVELGRRHSSRMLAAALCASALCAAALMGAEISLRYGQLAGVLAAALGGCWLGLGGRSAAGEGLMRGTGLLYAITLGGLMLSVFLSPGTPPWHLLLVLFAPLSLWFCGIGPVARLEGWRALLVRAAAVGVPLAVATAITVRALLAARAQSAGW